MSESDKIVSELRRIFDGDGSNEIGINLSGAIHDINYTGECDATSMRTLLRVLKQITEAEKYLYGR